MHTCAITAFLIAFSLVALPPAIAVGVEFPGREPGKAMASVKDGVLTLENQVLAATWEVRTDSIHPTLVVNKLTGERLDQRGAELFRLTTKPADAGDGSLAVAIRLDADRVVVLAGQDGRMFSEMASFSRADFPGEPKLVRVGKMNLKAGQSGGFFTPRMMLPLMHSVTLGADVFLRRKR